MLDRYCSMWSWGQALNCQRQQVPYLPSLLAVLVYPPTPVNAECHTAKEVQEKREMTAVIGPRLPDRPMAWQ